MTYPTLTVNDINFLCDDDFVLFQYLGLLNNLKYIVISSLSDFYYVENNQLNSIFDNEEFMITYNDDYTRVVFLRIPKKDYLIQKLKYPNRYNPITKDILQLHIELSPK